MTHDGHLEDLNLLQKCWSDLFVEEARFQVVPEARIISRRFRKKEGV